MGGVEGEEEKGGGRGVEGEEGKRRKRGREEGESYRISYISDYKIKLQTDG